jgi:hypothetical protein
MFSCILELLYAVFNLWIFDGGQAYSSILTWATGI